ncbi:hypothetical protein AB0E55_11560 [Amycolatopsis keratiniphila]|uniref:hypothetical protein n=1 Tax=Amycolatopsis keratiniphila TaxID=129921 RepID=UPI0033C58461
MTSAPPTAARLDPIEPTSATALNSTQTIEGLSMPQTDFDQGAVAMSELAVEQENTTVDRNEATTRFHIIDRILFDALGWQKQDCVLEEPLDGTYTDYSLGNPGTRLIVEAKKEESTFPFPYPPALRSSDLQASSEETLI